MNKQWKFWMLASALAFGVACGDDDESPSKDTDAGKTDAGETPEVDAGDEEVDAGDEEVDAGDEEVDAGDVDAGDTPDAAEPEPADIEIAGRWFGGNEYELSVLISNDVFGNGTVIEYDNEANVVYTQAPADAFLPNAFSRTVWSDLVDGSFYYCTIIYDAETLEDAKTRQVELDTSDPANTPCGVGPTWSHFVPVIEIEGKWDELMYGGKFEIDSLTWAATYASESKFAVVEYDNAANVVYTQDPTKTTKAFSKSVWTEIADGAFYYCTIDFDQDTLEAIKASTKVADDTALATGCNGFNWSKLTPATSN